MKMKQLTIIFTFDGSKNPYLTAIPNKDLAEMIKTINFTLFGEVIEYRSILIEDKEDE